MKVGRNKVPFPKGRSWYEGLSGTREGRDKDRHRNPFCFKKKSLRDLKFKNYFCWVLVFQCDVFISKTHYDVGYERKKAPGAVSREQFLLAPSTPPASPWRALLLCLGALPERSSLLSDSQIRQRQDVNTATKKETHIKSGRRKQTVERTKKWGKRLQRKGSLHPRED